MAAIVGWVLVVALIVGSICILKWCGPNPGADEDEGEKEDFNHKVVPFPSMPPNSMFPLIERFTAVEARIAELEERMGRTDLARMAAAEYFRRHGKRLKSLEECSWVSTPEGARYIKSGEQG